MPRTESASSADVGTLAQEHDCLLLDLDGTVFRGRELTEGATESLEKATGRKLFVTNNASRSADEVAGHLNELGLDATADDVVTSAQSAAHLLAAARRRVFRGWLDERVAALVVLSPGYEHPGDPRQPDNVHKH